MPAGEVIRYGIAVANALRRIHERDGVYGCLNPDHIMLTEGEVELAPAQSRIVLSPYAAPEQLRGSADDPRSDIFTLGAVLYEMLAGRRAFDSHDAVELRAAILERVPAPLEGGPRRLMQLVSTCMQKRPERRFQSALMVAAQLKLIAATERSADLAQKEPLRAKVNGHARGKPAQPKTTEPVSQPAVATHEEIAVTGPGKKRPPCPRCKATDVRPSRPKGALERALEEFGAQFSRCHRCYYRFMRIAFLTVSKE